MAQSGKKVADNIITKQVRNLEISKEAERQEKSYIGQLGHAIEPIIRPLGFDWKMGVSIITGLAAKEIVVSTMGILYQADMKTDKGTLKEKLISQTHNNGELKGQKVFSPLASYCFMLFVLIYFPCVAVIAAIKKESSWGWAVFTMVYTTAIAWIVAFATYQIGLWF
jgi:ferrous iron transport protein B